MLQTDFPKIFITFGLIALLWNLPKSGHHDQLCRWEQREIHNCENPQLVQVASKAHIVRFGPSSPVVSGFIDLIMTFQSTHWYVFKIQIWKGRATAKPEKREKAGKPQQICGRRQVSTMNCNVWTVFTIDGGQCSIYIPTVTLYMAVPYSNPLYGSSQ